TSLMCADAQSLKKLVPPSIRTGTSVKSAKLKQIHRASLGVISLRRRIDSNSAASNRLIKAGCIVSFEKELSTLLPKLRSFGRRELHFGPRKRLNPCGWRSTAASFNCG